jgi:hypothetical protein
MNQDHIDPECHIPLMNPGSSHKYSQYLFSTSDLIEEKC